ncbi:META domain-containing protein [Lacihabitans sp. LS3-19]|uniref:META domain-containing protein n=1 Tax=Lacihabitans sp. LS3-19 TaxID=2487335 RepID=UPI0020CBDA8C|nr:META domain-containing protein [Lacihabitans sp. LS3-19]
MKYLIIILFAVSTISCKKDADMAPNGATPSFTYQSPLFSKWILNSNESKAKINYEIVLDLKNEKNEKGNFILNGKSSINFYSAEFVVNDKKITISNILSTEIAGDSKATSFENDYIKRLSEVESFSIDQGMLTLNGKNQKMIFKVSN